MISLRNKINNLIEKITVKYLTTWEKAEDATGYFTVAVDRLERLSNLVETKRKRRTLKEWKIMYYMEEQEEARKQLILLRAQFEILERKEIGDHPMIKVNIRMKKTMRYAEGSEDHNRKDIGTIQNYIPSPK